MAKKIYFGLFLGLIIALVAARSAAKADQAVCSVPKVSTMTIGGIVYQLTPQQGCGFIAENISAEYDAGDYQGFMNICQSDENLYQSELLAYQSCLSDTASNALSNLTSNFASETSQNQQIENELQSSTEQIQTIEQEQASSTNVLPSSSVSITSAATSNIVPLAFPPMNENLQVGADDEAVVILQKFLESKGDLVVPTGTSLGYFGNLTKQALVKFQISAGLPATGYCGSMTRAVINKDNHFQ